MNRDVCEHFNPIDLPCRQCDDPALNYCHRFAVLMECVMLGGVDKHWNEMGTLLDEYNAAQRKWREAHGEPYVSAFGKD